MWVFVDLIQYSLTFRLFLKFVFKFSINFITSYSRLLVFFPGLYDACYQDVKARMFSLMHLYLEDIQRPLELDDI